MDSADTSIYLVSTVLSRQFNQFAARSRSRRFIPPTQVAQFVTHEHAQSFIVCHTYEGKYKWWVIVIGVKRSTVTKNLWHEMIDQYLNLLLYICDYGCCVMEEAPDPSLYSGQIYQNYGMHVFAFIYFSSTLLRLQMHINMCYIAFLGKYPCYPSLTVYIYRAVPLPCLNRIQVTQNSDVNAWPRLAMACMDQRKRSSHRQTWPLFFFVKSLFLLKLWREEW